MSLTLRALVDEGKLLRFGYGIHGRAEISRRRVGADGMGTAYDEGRSTQVSVIAGSPLKGRVSRRLAYKGE